MSKTPYKADPLAKPGASKEAPQTVAGLTTATKGSGSFGKTTESPKNK